VLPSISVKRNVTVPVGNEVAFAGLSLALLTRGIVRRIFGLPRT